MHYNSTVRSEPVEQGAVAWLVWPDGVAHAVRERPLLLGRGADNDVVLRDQGASRLHAVVVWSCRGLELWALGRNPTRVNGVEVSGRAPLHDGDALELPGAQLGVRAPAPSLRGSWRIALADGREVALRALPLTVGGGEHDDLHLPGWPPAALTLHGAMGALSLELGVPMTLNDMPLPGCAIERAEHGDTLALGQERLHLLAVEEDADAPTWLAGATPLARAVRFQFMPTGGLLAVRAGEGPAVSLTLSELRARLVAALLRPPAPYRPGEYVPDEILLPAIWPGEPARDRTDLNLLVHRIRKDLLSAGLDPVALLGRAPKGGATALGLAPGCEIEWGV